MLRTFLLMAPMLAIYCITATAAAADDSPRKRPTMDFGWRFVLGDPAGAQAANFDDSKWQSVDLPHDWSIFGPFDLAAPAGGGGGYLPTGIGGYRKTFQLPHEFKNRQIRIDFDGVYENSEV